MTVKKLLLLILLLLPMVLISCSDKSVGNRIPIPFVQNIISDTSSVEFAELATFRSCISDNCAVTVIGMPVDVVYATEKLLTSDRFNNVNGSYGADGLPDFSGETVNMMADFANYPYDRFVLSGEEQRLSEINVRNFISALDTSLKADSKSASEYIAKNGSKVVVLASSLSSVYGKYDIDTLIKTIGLNIPVISRIHVMMEQLYSGEPINLLIWTMEKKIGEGVYALSIPEIFHSKSDVKSHYQTFSPSETGSMKDRFLNLLDLYLQSGNTGKVSSLMVDDMRVDADTLGKIINEIRYSEDVSMSVYKEIFSEDFKFATPANALSDACFRYMRKQNLFTHKVAYPDMKAYISQKDTVANTFGFVEMKEKYVSDSFLDFLQKNAPKIFKSYVH